MSRRLKPLEDTPAWDIYRELLRFVHERHVFPTEHGFFVMRAQPLGIVKTIGEYRYYIKRLMSEGFIKSDAETKSLVPPGVTLSFSDEFLAVLPEAGTCQIKVSQPPDNVYVFRDTKGLYKIGVSNDPVRRMADIRRTHPDEYECLHLIPTENAFRLESFLHDYFASKRVHGEWFRLNERDMIYLRKAGDHLLNHQQPLWLEVPDRRRRA